LARGEDPDGDAATLDVLGAIEKFPGIRPDPEAFVESLEPLQPRLYSISSSPRAHEGRVTLTIDTVRYTIGARDRLGVASTYFAERLPEGSPLKVYVQKAHGFALPADSGTPIIMVGPGTGVAPFRAFLQERLAQKASGGAWLFFGHQREASDFFYREELEGLMAAGVLTKLSTAWSRDAAPKVYVQDRMREAGAEVWDWLQRGAHFYICGDAKRMAKDVETMLAGIVAEHGALGADGARTFIAELKKTGRYQADVY
jgi:sulfite reductase (NADPH) flavoprotein alpha-component